MVRPSYVLGGRAMEIVYSDDDLKVGFWFWGGLAAAWLSLAVLACWGATGGCYWQHR
jgi:biotin carboxylase